MEPVVNVEPVAVRRRTAAQMLDCGETTVWRLCKEGKLDTIKVGKDDRITVASIKKYAKVPA
jgi:excisionase family DNA binding protein